MSGVEWVVEAHGCAPAPLGDLARMKALFDTLVREMALLPVAPPVWHRFPAPGGITGVCLLAESHLACHTFPEYGSLCLNLFCCRPRPEFDFETCLKRDFNAAAVCVRRIERPYRYDEPKNGELPELRSTHTFPVV